MSLISTSLIHRAIAHYRVLGFTPADVPLVVPQAVSDATRPFNRLDVSHNPGVIPEADLSLDPVGTTVYVASAEQSFAHLINEGGISEGLWQALTPCVRAEPVLDDEHYHVFLKLELIHVGSPDYEPLLDAAASFFQGVGVAVRSVETSSGHDLLAPCGLELGSYGTRSISGLAYAYGTGIAEPRTTLAIWRARA